MAWNDVPVGTMKLRPAWEVSVKIPASLFNDDLFAFAVGAATAILASMIVLIVYRFIVGRERPFIYDVLGTTTAAIGGSLAATLASLINDTGGSGSSGVGGVYNNWVAAGAAIAALLAGLVTARRLAGSLEARSVASDIVPLGLAAAIAFVTAVFWQALLNFS